MKDIIIQKLKDKISTLTQEQADAFLIANLSSSPTVEDCQNLLSKVQSGEIEVK